MYAYSVTYLKRLILLFYKMHGAGNDFIMLTGSPDLTAKQIAGICHRRTGLGADGVIWLEKGSDSVDFVMHYFNSDGSRAAFCGNGARCSIYLAAKLQLFTGDSTRFMAGDGLHNGKILADNQVLVTITSPSGFRKLTAHDDLPAESYFVNTGVEHVVCYVENLQDLDVQTAGRKIRYSAQFPNGTNVNFIKRNPDSSLNIRTYERGVEAETLACGTGISAAAFTDMQISGGAQSRQIRTVAGYLLTAGWQDKEFVLTGPAEIVAKGELSI